ncbi:hypothetical protein CBA19CS11_15320 [Caballeronia novacaledonica]|uniref:hypothetical protein n=1 Tax=Caballeronia novacaledonica TaxID=1544861 RepID=UPI001EE22DC0|nr:hypothetical protein [Caballeronia novacaledonica]GJH10224.1 hypothetical protein CBA19CS11_15320 [Caballeronia novacaledonica]
MNEGLIDAINVFPAARIDDVIDSVFNLEKLGNVATLMRMLRPIANEADMRATA